MLAPAAVTRTAPPVSRNSPRRSSRKPGRLTASGRWRFRDTLDLRCRQRHL